MLSHTRERNRLRSLRSAVESLESRTLLAATLDPLLQPKFVNPLPLPGYVSPDVSGGTHYTVTASQFQQQLGLYDPVSGLPLTTTVWGYNGSYPGPTFEVQKGTPVDVTWLNGLVDADGDPLSHLFPIDTTLHWAYSGHHGMPPMHSIAEDGVPTVTHLHGGHVNAASDGGPDAWYTPGFELTGPAFSQQTYHYENDQDAATLWYHDHALGITRLNVYAGLAGFYLVRDALDTGRVDDPATPQSENPLGLPAEQYEIPLVVQDRIFTADGQLHFPSTDPANPAAPDPTVLPEFFGDTILVNGKAWPFVDVEPRQYRLRLLNGSDSRFYNFGMNGLSFTQIGTDQGLLDKPVTVRKLLLAPGERADVVVDFSRFANRTIVMSNDAKTPFPKGGAADPQTTGQIMAFRVGGTVTEPAPVMASQFQTIAPLVADAPTRELALYEMMDEYGRMQPMLGTPQQGPMMWDDPTTEMVRLGDTEVWEVYNTTPDAHPIHLHLVKFQVVNRQRFTANVDMATGVMSNTRLVGQPKAPTDGDAGWKDTVIMYPGEVTRIIATFDKPGEYVWHCHILSHEDHEMMRRLVVVDPDASDSIIDQSRHESADSTPFSDLLLDESASSASKLLEKTRRA